MRCERRTLFQRSRRPRRDKALGRQTLYPALPADTGLARIIQSFAAAGARSALEVPLEPRPVQRIHSRCLPNPNAEDSVVFGPAGRSDGHSFPALLGPLPTDAERSSNLVPGDARCPGGCDGVVELGFEILQAPA